MVAINSLTFPNFSYGEARDALLDAGKITPRRDHIFTTAIHLS